MQYIEQLNLHIAYALVNLEMFLGQLGFREPHSRRPYHGRNALLDVDPSSIQHQMQYQDSIEQNDDRMYGGSSGRTSAEPDRHARGGTAVNQPPAAAAEEEDDDGDWC